MSLSNIALIFLGFLNVSLRNLFINEDLLKIPGYKILFPKSWSQVGYARVVVYIKSSLYYEQLHDYEETNIQSIWIKGGFQKGKKTIIRSLLS